MSLARGVLCIGVSFLVACRAAPQNVGGVTFSCTSTSQCADGFFCVDGVCGTEPPSPKPIEAGEHPVVASFDVVNAAGGPRENTRLFEPGDPLRVSYSVTDAEGLADAPLTLQYTTDNVTWRDVANDRPEGARPTWFGTATEGASTAADTVDVFSAPTAEYFRLRLIARDAADQRSEPRLSDLLNLPRWSFYAGRDAQQRAVQRRPHHARMFCSSHSTGVFAVHPLTGDVYAADYGAKQVSSPDHAIYKLDAQTNEVTLAFHLGASASFLDGGVLSEVPTLQFSTGNHQPLAFDVDGRLYAAAVSDGRVALYRLDLEARRAIRYLGGGTSTARSAPPEEVAMAWSGYAFDPQNTLYFFSYCPATTSGALRVMRAPQLGDGGTVTAGTATWVAGSCAVGHPDAGAPALESPLTAPGTAPVFLKVVPVDDRLFYVHHRVGRAPVRVLDGRVYPTRVPGGSGTIGFNRVTGQMYSSDFELRRFEPSYEPVPDAEVLTVVIPRRETGDCTLDDRDIDGGTDAEWACVNASAHVDFTPAGDVLLADGTSVVATGPYRIRRLGADGRLRTVLGTRRFEGDGVERQAARSTFSGIAYKPAAAPNQEVAPEGLYVVDEEGDVLSRIEPDSHPTRPGRVTVLGGNMANLGNPVFDVPPTPLLPLRYMASSLVFSSDGLPFFNIDRRIVTLSGAGQLKRVSGYNGDVAWTTTATLNSVSFGQGTQHPMAVTGTGVFIAGTSCSAYNGSCPEAPRIRYFAFTGQPFDVIGGSATAYTPDLVTPQNVQTATLAASAAWMYRSPTGLRQQPFLLYDTDVAPPRLYFVEGTALRYVTNPLRANVDATLRTLMTNGAGYGFFSFNPPGGPYPAKSMVFFLSGSDEATQLSCQANPEVPGAASWCPLDGAVLGPGGFTRDVALGPNGPSALTWRTPTALLVKGRQAVLEFDAR
ncbi:MAG: hypothetical protein JNG84_09425 [Archangium sp.]|nr:hypothetical protein [Archangium sp.]